jgi:hypothetical protein
MKSVTAVFILAALVGFGVATDTQAGASKTKSTAPSPAPVQMKMDTKAGPAHLTIDGKLSKIDGQVYVVEDYAGKEYRLYVSKDTKRLRGDKKPGDTIRAEITKGGHANTIY